jgi:hypothetical protein
MFVDPTGLWGKTVHQEMTESAYAGLKLKRPKTAAKHLNKGSIEPDLSLVGVHEWHGHGVKGVKKSQLVKAKGLWKKGKYADAYFEIGKAMHAIQDYYAHRVKYKKKKVSSRQVADGYLSSDANGKLMAEGFEQFIDDKFLEDAKSKYTIGIGTNVHTITADNTNARFNKNDKWVWVSSESDNPRYNGAITGSSNYLNKFMKWTKERKKKK